MKLSKAKLIKETKDELNKLGYQEMKDKFIGADGLFAKLLENDLFLTLGFTISNLYEARFTASFYLSKTTIWAALWGDIPRDCYKRIGHFLTRDERKMLLKNEDGNTSDVWWNYNDDSIESFITAIKITEQRFLSQPGILDKIESSSIVYKLQSLSKEVIRKYLNIQSENLVYDFTSRKKVDIDVEWFELAEEVLIERNEIVNPYTINRLAADAWRQNYLRNLQSTNTIHLENGPK
ncbi:hypothetical protein [Pedobacter metabolipauper]|uniref:Uncharacterized protein n=1 Tax=Pedobacter metabolipauper TaxID=425513 RepID=A0A4V3D1K6_9SPHI|nr:hypothetical protein [Pedobacter metabolipauper]TDQ11563.1 hypothetical protein ATK78_0686 [Pedobacter metabolipauper]